MKYTIDILPPPTGYVLSVTFIDFHPDKDRHTGRTLEQGEGVRRKDRTAYRGNIKEVLVVIPEGADATTRVAVWEDGIRRLARGVAAYVSHINALPGDFSFHIDQKELAGPWGDGWHSNGNAGPLGGYSLGDWFPHPLGVAPDVKPNVVPLPSTQA